VETLGKGVALIASVGLGLAFLYDAVFFRCLDGRLARLMVMSDHIEAAIVILPIVGLAGLLMWSTPYMYHARLPHWVMYALGVVVLVEFAVLIYLDRVSMFDIALMAIVGLGGAVAVVAFARRYVVPVRDRGLTFPGGIKPSVLLFYTFLIFAGATVLLAYASAKGLLKELSKPSRLDTVWLNDMSSVRVVVRMIDRGTIVGVPSNPPEFLFIPKEQIRRVDLRE
jgi:hypothetical protein